jgi:DNA-binding transcriptional LysR family regulator
MLPPCTLHPKFMQISLRQLRIFEAVARHSSISRAASEMHLTQPAVSMQMKQLEEHIGVRLFEKAGNKFSLTDAGAELRIHAQRLNAQTVALLAAMQQFQGVGGSILRLAVVSTANYFLPPLIATLSRQHPRMRTTLQVANHEAVLNSLINSVTDLAITGQPPESAELIAQPFKDNPLVVIAPPEHRLATQKSISMNEFSAETLVVRESGSGTRAAVERHFADHGQTPLNGCELNTNEAIKQAVQAGLGLAVVSVQTIELELETRRLVILPVEGFPILRRWYLVHRDRRLSAAAAAFRELLLAPLDFDKIMAVGSKSGKPLRATKITR